MNIRPFAFPTPVFIIGTYDENGNPNVMNAAWGGICNSIPPCINISVRKERLTYQNLMSSNCFTINLPSEQYAKEADYFGIASGSKENKFEKTKLTPIKGEKVNAPYISEFPIAIECEVKEIFELDSHVQFIGDIKNIIADEECFDENGKLDIQKAHLIAYDPSSSTYYKIGDKVGKAFSIGKEI